ncbi:MAG TPA: VOC family protein [Polyangiaceae bacterium]|nr:VOC family protein [Polyangiaceae bacterium]
MSTSPNSMPSDAGDRAAGLNAFRPRIAFVTYNVENIERALAFYVGVLGMQEQMRFPIGGGMNEVVLAFPDSKASSLVLIWRDEDAVPIQHGDGYSRFVIRVSDIDCAAAALAESGVVLQTPPTDAGSLRFAMLRDPDGYLIELLQFKRA